MAFSRRDKDRDYAIVDANAAINEMKRDALHALAPAPREKEERIDLITLLRGKRPNLYQLLLANVEQEGWLSLAEKKTPPLDKGFDAIRFIRSHATSLDGFRSKQIVEIAKTEAPPLGSSILDVLKRGRK